MATSVTFNGTTYSIPASGETGWSALSSFLIDVANNAQTLAAQKGAIRIATSTPVTISSTDYTVLSNLTIAGAVAFTLPIGVDKTIYVIGDTKGDAETNNITISPNSGTINGAATYVIANNFGAVAIQYSTAASEWKIIGRYFTKIDAANETYGVLSAANGGTGVANNAAATLTRSGNHALTFTTTGVTGLTLPTTGTVATTSNLLSDFAATSSAQLAGVISDETGSGALVFANTPTLVTPVLGAATGTSLNLSGLTASKVLTTDGSKNLASASVTTTELGYLSGVTAPTGSGALVLANTPTLITPVLGAASGTSLLLSGLTASKALVTDGSKVLTSSAVTATELGYLGGVTSPTGSGALVLGTSPTIATPSFTTSAVFRTNGEVRFNNSGNTFYTGFKGGEAAANKIWTLPLVDGAGNQALSTNGSGTLIWQTVASSSTATATSQGLVTSYAPTIQSAIKSTSAGYTVLTADGYSTILVTTGASTITITLPAASSNGGRTLVVTKVDNGTGKITIARAGSDTVAGLTSVDVGVGALNQYATCTLVSDGTATWGYITPPTDVIAASYHMSSSTSTTAANPINFDTKEFDTHSAVTTGASWKFTAPVAGIYEFGVWLEFSTGHFCNLYKNGTRFNYTLGSASTLTYGTAIYLISLAAGDYIDARPDSTITVTGGTLASAAATAWCSIKRVK